MHDISRSAGDDLPRPDRLLQTFSFVPIVREVGSAVRCSATSWPATHAFLLTTDGSDAAAHSFYPRARTGAP